MKKVNSLKQRSVSKQNVSCSKKNKARRKEIMDWLNLESSAKYRTALRKSIGLKTTDQIADEVLDGIFLSLHARNEDKSWMERKRILRRIVEKRQAQAIHVKMKKSRDREATFAVIFNSAKCMERIHRLRFAM